MNMKTRIIRFLTLLSLLCVGFPERARAQYDAMFTQYMNNEMFINPAWAGSREAMGVTLLHRQQWIGFEGRPVTTTFTVNGPLYENKMGIGLSFLNEKIAVLNRNMVYLTYAYRIRTGNTGHLSFGVMGGIHIQTNRLSEITTTTSGDPQFIQDADKYVTPNFGFGIYYFTDKFYVGLSTPRLINDQIRYDEGGLVKNLTLDFKKVHFYLTSGGIVRLTPGLLIKPQAMLKAVSNAPLEFDLDLSLLFRERYWGGLAYRSNADISIMAGVYITPQFLLSYAYDIPVTRINKFSSGSHELALSYLFRFSGRQIVSPRYF